MIHTNKKNLSFWSVTALVTAFIFVVLSGCNEEEPDNQNPDFVFNLDKYFSIDEGTLSAQQFPGTDTATIDEAPVVDSIYGATIIPEGGENRLNIIMSEPTASIFVGVAGETNGYYQVFAPESGPVEEFNFDVDFAEEDFRNVYYLQIAGIDEDGNMGPADSLKIVTVDAALGELTVSCEWDTLVDIDLYLKEPNGDTIYFDNAESDNLGYLDMDSNPFCWLDSINAENIYYGQDAAVEAGTYHVLLRYLTSCDVSETVNYSITVRFNGELLDISGVDNPYSGSFEPSETSTNPHEVFSFNIASDATKSTRFAKQRMIRFGYNDDATAKESISPEKSEWEKRRNK